MIPLPKKKCKPGKLMCNHQLLIPRKHLQRNYISTKDTPQAPISSGGLPVAKKVGQGRMWKVSSTSELSEDNNVWSQEESHEDEWLGGNPLAKSALMPESKPMTDKTVNKPSIKPTQTGWKVTSQNTSPLSLVELQKAEEAKKFQEYQSQPNILSMSTGNAYSNTPKSPKSGLPATASWASSKDAKPIGSMMENPLTQSLTSTNSLETWRIEPPVSNNSPTTPGKSRFTFAKSKFDSMLELSHQQVSLRPHCSRRTPVPQSCQRKTSEIISAHCCPIHR